MAKRVMVLEEIVQTLKTISAPTRVIEAFVAQSEAYFTARPKTTIDDVQIGSGFGMKSRKGTVDLVLNDELTQMSAGKAREIGLMLIEASEAAQSDEMFVALLERLGITETEHLGRILIDLREIRQGTRGTSRPQ